MAAVHARFAPRRWHASSNRRRIVDAGLMMPTHSPAAGA
jgi:hypothetical protein